MRVVTVETPELGDRSYLIHDGEVALVVDPQRDVDRMEAAAAAEGVRIVVVAETHMHNDYVTGGLALARAHGADYLVSGAEPVAFERRAVADGDELTVGSMQVRVLATPGHTPNHVSYAVTDGKGPGVVLTGGSLLYGTVGRTDLIGAEVTDELTRAQWRSAHRLVEVLPGETQVLPTHGFGSFCSSSPTSGATVSTLDQERTQNLALVTEDEERFVKTLLAGLAAYPRYYAHMGAQNLSGPSAPDLTPPAALDPGELARRLRAGEWVVDLRSRQAYATSHLAGTVCIEQGTLFTTYFGWVLPYGAPVTLVGDTPEQVAQAQRDLCRIGLEHLAGAATGALERLAEGIGLRSYPSVDFAELARALGAGEPVVVLDVRRDDEWESAGHLPDAIHVPIHELLERIDELPAGRLWVHCAAGFRAAVAASLLDRAGRDVVVVDDDFSRARAAGLEVVGVGG
jgi:hydroxyacylglutathione hydrolase